jgi:hypothetical protein
MNYSKLPTTEKIIDRSIRFKQKFKNYLENLLLKSELLKRKEYIQTLHINIDQFLPEPEVYDSRTLLLSTGVR